MTPANVRDLLIAWSLFPFLVPSRTRLLLEFFDPVSDACNASSRMLQGLLGVDAAEAELVTNPFRSEWALRVAEVRDSVVTLVDPEYPPLLKEIPDPPLALHVRGRRELLAAESIAVVGSRRASPYGLNAARQIVVPLVRDAGLTIVSGLARGIDAAAHEAALDQRGATIAVLGTGIDVVYPRCNRRLFDRIASEGLIVSEFAPGTPPLAFNFPMRNRVISGMCVGTVIVEATRRSGSLITARTAAEQGREVFAIPGSIFSDASEGPHRLIQYGAKLVHDANDVLEELQGHSPVAAEKRALPPEPLREVFAALALEEGTHVETAAAKLGRPVNAIAEALLELELGGWVQALPGSRYVRLR